MKLFTPAILVLASLSLNAQTWCVPTTAIPYNQDQPGITNVTLNTINRNSLDIENYPNNSYVLTTATTTLTKGNTYTISVTHTRDANMFPNVRNNVRVWIDYNVDGQLDDPGETVLSMDLQTFGTTTGNFTVPASANIGMTRMRVTIKMSSDGGHTLPTPCDNPADPIGYHGEIEDYNITLVGTSGVEETPGISSFNVYPVPAYTDQSLMLSFSLEKQEQVRAELYNLAGEKVAELIDRDYSAGTHNCILDSKELKLETGVYFIKLNAGGGVATRRIFMVN